MLKIFFLFFSFLMTTLKHCFIDVLAFFILCFLSFFCFSFCSIKKTKNAIFSSNTSFLTSRQFLQKHHFGTNWHYLCFLTYPQNTIKIVKQWKSWTSFNTTLGPIFKTKQPNLGPILLLALQHQYIYIYNSFSFYVSIYIHTQKNLN